MARLRACPKSLVRLQYPVLGDRALCAGPDSCTKVAPSCRTRLNVLITIGNARGWPPAQPGRGMVTTPLLKVAVIGIVPGWTLVKHTLLEAICRVCMPGRELSNHPLAPDAGNLSQLVGRPGLRQFTWVCASADGEVRSGKGGPPGKEGKAILLHA